MAKKKSPADNPTIEFYGHLDKAFDFFNKKLFDKKLPKVMFELTNKKKVGGFFKSKTWQAVDSKYVHTIAVNPQFIVHSTPLQVYDTIVHEMVHLWQHVYGDEGRGNYHNTEWAEKMESIGLMPSDTGLPGGKKTGQSVSDYPIPGGLFEQACVDFLLAGNYISFVDASIDDAEVLKFRNQLLKDCVDKGESLADHLNNFNHKLPEGHKDEIAPVVNVSVEDYLDEIGADPVVSNNRYEVTPANDDKSEPTTPTSKKTPEAARMAPTTPPADKEAKSSKEESEYSEEENKDPYQDAIDANNPFSKLLTEFNELGDDDDADDDIHEAKTKVEAPASKVDKEAQEVQKSEAISKSEYEEDEVVALKAELSRVAVSPIEDTASVNIKVEDTDKADKKAKVTYECPGCSSKVWGKPNLNLKCVDCDNVFESK